MIMSLNEQNYPHDDGQNRPETDQSACFETPQDRGIEQKPGQCPDVIADGRCPRCNEVVSDGRVCLHCGNTPGVSDAGKQTDRHCDAIVGTMKCFVLSDAEADIMFGRISCDIERDLNGFLKRTALTALLPLVQQRAQGFFQANHVPHADAEELAAMLIAKTWQAISKEWPRGNVGSFIATIRIRLLLDYRKAKRIQKKWFGDREDMAVLENLEDSDERSLQFFLLDFDPSERDLIEQVLAGDKWKEIESQYAERAAALRETLFSLEWEGQSVPLRKKRRRQPRPDA